MPTHLCTIHLRTTRLRITHSHSPRTQRNFKQPSIIKPRLMQCMLAILPMVLVGCASVDETRGQWQFEAATAPFTQGKLALQPTAENLTEAQKLSEVLLAQPLGQPEAVQLALANSPALQAMQARYRAQGAEAAQQGRIANPLFTFERTHIGNELELARLLSFGLLDLLTLPQRKQIAQQQYDQNVLQQAGEVIDQVTQVRQAWVDAVATRQLADYSSQVLESAQTSHDMAMLMRRAGNFSHLAQMRHQMFMSEAMMLDAQTRQAALSSRERLVRLLGLSNAQANQLQLPDRLPALPSAPRATNETSDAVNADRLDIKLARMQLDAAARAQGLGKLTSVTDIELGLRHDNVSDSSAGTSNHKNGFEVGVTLPLFDFGEYKRASMNARTQAATQQLEATVRNAASTVRERYAAYLNAYQVARHYQQDVLPISRAINNEMLLRYNGMFIGVFDLMAQAREQVRVVQQALNAQRQFWLEDAALQAELVGRPVLSSAALPMNAGANSSSKNAADAH